MWLYIPQIGINFLSSFYLTCSHSHELKTYSLVAVALLKTGFHPQGIEIGRRLKIPIVSVKEEIYFLWR